MRKLFAMVATVAMVLSMFAGIAFAAAQEISVDIKETMLEFTADAEEVYVEGDIVDDDDAVIEDDFFVQVVGLEADGDPDLANVLAVGLALDGSFKIDIEDIATGRYAVVLVDVDAGDYDYDVADAPKFYVIPAVAYTGDLSFTWGETDNLRYVGVAKSFANDHVYLLDDNDEIIGAAHGYAISGSGYFTVSVDKEDFEITGDVRLVAVEDADVADFEADTTGDFTVIAVGEVEEGDLSDYLSIDPSSVPYLIADREIEVEIDADNDDLNIPAGYEYTFEIENEDGDTIAITNEDVDDDVATLEFTAAKADRGTATVTVEIVSSDATNNAVLYSGEVTFEVVRPSSITWLGLPDDNTLDFSARSWNFFPEAYYGADYDLAPFYVISAEGAAELDETTIEDGEFVNIEFDETGTFELTVEAYDMDPDDDDAELIDEETFTVTISGGTMTVEPGNLQYDQDQDVVITVEDEDGEAVNNATFYFLTELAAHGGDLDNDLLGTEAAVAAADIQVIAAGDVNAKNGVYEVELENDDALLETPGDYVVFAFQGDDLIATAAIKVLGDRVYDVVIDSEETVLGGLDTEMVVDVTEDGAAVKTLDAADFVLVYDGDEITGAVTIDERTNGEYTIIIDGEDLVDAGEYTLLVDNGTEYGEATFEVVLPQIVVEGGKVTHLYESELTVKVIDPRDNTELDWNLLVVGNYADILDLESGVTDIDANVDDEFEVTGSEDGVELTIMAEADFDGAEDDEEVAGITISVVSPDDAEVDVDCLVEVAEATLTATPSALVLGVPTAVTFILADANGNGIEGYDVTRGDTVIGETNEDGKLVYTTTLYDMVTFEVELNEDEAEVLEVTVTPGMDSAAPVVSAPETTDKNTATITVTDNVRIQRIVFNGVEDKDFFQGPTWSKQVNLVVGANKFTVVAQDSNYNTVTQTVTINYVPAANSSTVLQGASVQRQGDFIFVQIRQFEDLGATLTWDAAAKSATFVAGGKTVVVTVGSTTAMVNGVAATMPSAPINVGGRVMVPTRFIAEALGWKVDWAAGDIVTITLP